MPGAYLCSMNMITEDPEAGSAYRSMARAIRYLAEHYADQPSLDEAAEAVGLSPFHFQRLFTPLCRREPEELRRRA